MRTKADNTIAASRPARAPALNPSPRVEVVIPVHNQERALPEAVRQVHACLAATHALPFRVTIADIASSDGTATVARFLARELPNLRYLHIAAPGRGRALRGAWGSSDAEVVACVDVDRPTDIVQLPALLGPLLAGRADLVVGSRLAPGAQLTGGFRRQAISRSYNALLGCALAAAFSDPQCGFKAARRAIIGELLPLIEDEGSFFDIELLYLAQRNSFSIREVPVDWVDDRDARAPITRTAIEDLRGIARLLRRTRDGRDLINTLDRGVPGRQRASVVRTRAAIHDRARRSPARPARTDGCRASRPDTQPATPVLP